MESIRLADDSQVSLRSFKSSRLSTKDHPLIYHADGGDSFAGSSGTGTTGQYAVYKRRWLGILALAFMNIAISWGWLVVSSISTATVSYFNLSSPGPVNWLSTVVLFSYSVSTPLVCWACEYHGIRLSIAIAAILTVIGSWLRYAGTVKKIFPLVMVAQIFIGFAQPFALSTPAYYTDKWFTSKTRVSANAVATLANPLGGAIAGLVSPAIVTDNKGTNMALYMLVTAIVATVVSLACLFIPNHPPLPPCPSSSISKLSTVDSLKMLVKHKTFLATLYIFSISVGNFNAISTFVNQIMAPYGYSQDEAGYAAAVMIVAGLVCSAVFSPIVDRLHIFLHAIFFLVPVLFGCTVAIIYMSTSSLQLAGPFISLGVFGAAAFILLPLALEWVQEQTSPCNANVLSSLLWIGGQIVGAIFVIVGNALQYPKDKGSPPQNMHRALILFACFQGSTILALYFVRGNFSNTRVDLDKLERQNTRQSEAEGVQYCDRATTRDESLLGEQ